MGTKAMRGDSGFGADLENRSGFNAREVRWETIRNEVIIQWKGVRRQNLSENFNFQIRLNTATNAIAIIYGPRSTPDNATTFQPEVGLRGSSNLLLSNLNSRRVESGAETWANSLAGSSFGHKVRFTNSSPAKSWNNGQIYTWSPCTPPTVSVSLHRRATVQEGVWL
ncbi:MAG: hypothetical protein IPI41_17380 [Flavobacteriales bacterium]|nr:hypothetical protein [Flavobacteriales bacterium]